MMMIRTAGGPPPVHPLDFNDRKTPLFTRTTWIALGVVAASHVGLGVALYYQRFELAPAIATPPEGKPIDTFLVPPPKPPEAPPKPIPTKEPPAPNTKVNELPSPVTATEPLTIVTGDTIATGTVINTKDAVDPSPVVGAVTEPTPPQPPAVIRNPTWERQPSAAQMMRAYPTRAINAGISGSVGLNCLVERSGRVTDCDVTRETPGAYGFGRAAQDLSRYFQVNPRTVNGAAEGSRVNINLRFQAPD
jgi:protein TonB